MFALRRKPDGKSCDLSEATQGNRWMKAAWWPVVMECRRPTAGNVKTTHSPEKKKKKQRQAGSASRPGWSARDREASRAQWMIIYVAEGTFQSAASRQRQAERPLVWRQHPPLRSQRSGFAGSQQHSSGTPQARDQTSSIPSGGGPLWSSLIYVYIH